jgi:hypothetical protein
LVTTAGESVILPNGAFQTYSVFGGVPPYRATSSEPSIVLGNINDKTLSIGAVAGGEASVRVFDNSGAAVSIAVTVGSSNPLFSTAPSIFTLRSPGQMKTCAGGASTGGETAVYAIAGGARPYSISSDQPQVVAVEKVDESNFRVTAVSLTMPAGMEAQVTVSGGQPPYYPAGGIPAAIQVTPAVSNDGKFKIVGNLASKLDVTFVDTAGQSVKVEVEINTATVSFRLSPSPISVNENSTDELTFSLFGFYGDEGTGAASGTVCLYLSDPSYLGLDPSRTTCSAFSAQNRTFKLITGTRGSRCVSSDTPIQIRAVDSQSSIALGTVTILDVGSACVAAGTTVTGALTLQPSNVTVAGTGSSSVLISRWDRHLCGECGHRAGHGKCQWKCADRGSNCTRRRNRESGRCCRRE